MSTYTLTDKIEAKGIEKECEKHIVSRYINNLGPMSDYSTQIVSDGIKMSSSNGYSEDTQNSVIDIFKNQYGIKPKFLEDGDFILNKEDLEMVHKKIQEEQVIKSDVEKFAREKLEKSEKQVRANFSYSENRGIELELQVAGVTKEEIEKFSKDLSKQLNVEDGVNHDHFFTSKARIGSLSLNENAISKLSSALKDSGKTKSFDEILKSENLPISNMASLNDDKKSKIPSLSNNLTDKGITR